MPMSWYVAVHARQAGPSPRANRDSGIRASRQASITGTRPAGISRERISTVTPWVSSLARACSSRSGAARSRSVSSHREPPRERTPRCPSQYRTRSPRKAARAETRKSTSSVSGAASWKATTAAPLTRAPVGTTGTSAPRKTSRKSEG
ncbi:hypothetical protein EES47_16950 [Streptomyces sp. ADI98-12]|nr:hypothetical protein EES47_16950 [Streptomyces sp. ADI98-12]